MKKKKTLFIRATSVLLTILFLLTLLPSCSISINAGSQAEAEAEKNKEIENIIAKSQLQYPAQNEDFFYNVYTDYVKITKYLGESGEVTVPSTVEGLPVYAIGKEAFKETAVTKVKIEEGIYIIGEHCFENCILLENIYLPDSLVKIGQYAFSRCEVLKEITFPRQVYDISNYICYECPALETVKILSEKENSKIYQSAFIRCTSLKNIYIPGTVASIAIDSFNGISEDATFYGPVGCSAATYCAERFYNYVVVEDGEFTENDSMSNESDATQNGGKTDAEQETPGNANLWVLIGIGVLFVGIIAGLVIFLIVRRRRY